MSAIRGGVRAEHTGRRKELTMASTHSVRRISPARLVAVAVSAVFIVVGVAGFVPGLTTDLDSMTFAGHESMALLLGVFHVSVLHNAVHLLFGVAGLVLARSAAGATVFLIGGGVIYLLLWLYGIVIDLNSGANFVPFDSADNWLHLALGVGMAGIGLALRRTRVA
jgi:hypothetical protein